MTLAEAIAVLAAGVGAGTINAVVGSGTLLTFPTLMAVGYPPVLANVSNTMGLVFGSISGAWGYRRELRGQARRAIALGSASLLGGIAGAVALLALPDEAFRAIVPGFIVLALVLVVVQPRLGAWLEQRHAERRPRAIPWLAIFGTGVYGGYFGAAQGIILLAVLGLTLPDDLHRSNALKNVLAAIANGVAALVFVAVADVAWAAVGLIAAGSVLGGQLGAAWGRRLPERSLRAVIVVVGVVAIVQLLAA